MATKTTTWSVRAKDSLGRTYVARDYNNVSNSSLTPKGKVDVVTPHPHDFRDVTSQVTVYPDTDTGFAWPKATVPSVIGYGRTSTKNGAIANFHRRAASGEKASLGVTAASWNQSYQMIGGRLMNIANRMHLAEQYLRANKRRREYLRRRARRLKIAEAPPDLVLEGFFGWAPLFQDIHDGLAVLGAPLNDGWVRGRRKAYERNSGSAIDRPATNPSRIWMQSGPMTCTITAVMSITNQNLWLLNRLGLINPVGVMWDRVPWSFVVNLFVNVNQMIYSLSDEVGVSYSKGSETWFWDQTHQDTRWTNRTYGPAYSKHDCTLSFDRLKGRKRVLTGGVPKPRWDVRVPGVAGNWQFAAIYSSLAAQKAASIRNILHI